MITYYSNCQKHEDLEEIIRKEHPEVEDILLAQIPQTERRELTGITFHRRPGDNPETDKLKILRLIEGASNELWSEEVIILWPEDDVPKDRYHYYPQQKQLFKTINFNKKTSLPCEDSEVNIPKI